MQRELTYLGGRLSSTMAPGMVPRRLLWSAVLAASIAAFIAGVLLGRFAFRAGDAAASVAESSRGASAAQYVVDGVSAETLHAFLRELTRKPHVAGTPQDDLLAGYIADTWREQGLDRVEQLRYEVLLSYPQPQPNKVQVLDGAGTAVFTAQHRQPPLQAPEESDPDVPQNFNAYSAPGRVQGKLVYANYGREEDFLLLQMKNITVEGRIVIARYGKIFRGNKAQLCHQFGCAGLILYSDPADSAPLGPNATYPRAVYLPPEGAQLGTVYMGSGDPLTPFYPSIDSAFRINESDANLPRIPVQPISARDAAELLRLMPALSAAPEGWSGGLDLAYYLGPGPEHSDHTVLMDIHTRNRRANTTNVIGTIRGYEEPDRYVLLGNHRDAWIFGAVDPSSGTAAMLELSRVLANLRKDTGWRPRRSLVFCSWGAEEYGLVGSVEWVEHRRQQLTARAIAYLNVDLTLNGNDTLRALGVPLLHGLLFEAAKAVPNPDPAEVAAGRRTVYDTWLFRKRDNTTGLPEVGIPGDGSDHKGFLTNAGIPAADVTYGGPGTYAMYHTLYETYFYVTQLQDRGLHFTAAVAKMWGEMARRLADDTVLPFSVVQYASYLQRSIAEAEADFGPLLRQNGCSLDDVKAAIDQFTESADNFQNHFLRQLDLDNPLSVRQANDILMAVERSFVNPRGLPDRPDFNHVIFSPSALDGYQGVTFPGLADLLHGLETLPPDQLAERWDSIKLHISVLSYLIGSAAHGLMQDI